MGVRYPCRGGYGSCFSSFFKLEFQQLKYKHQLPMMVLTIFLRFLRCSSLETTEIRFDVRMAQTLTSFRKYRVHLRIIQLNSSTFKKPRESIFSFIQLRYSPNSSGVKNFRNMLTFTYFLPLLALIKRITEQKIDNIFQAYSADFPIDKAHFSTIFSDFSLLLKKEQNWLIMLDQLFFLALRISFSKVFSILFLGFQRRD